MRKGTDLIYLLGFCVMLVFVSLFIVFTIVNMMFNFFSIKVLLSIKKKKSLLCNANLGRYKHLVHLLKIPHI